MTREGLSGGRVLGLVLVLVALGLAGVAAAGERELEGKVRAGQEVVVAAGETVASDLYASGGTVQVDGAVDGDVVAAGGQVHIAGRVGGDVVMAGGSLSVPGEVGGDIRAAGGQLAISGSVGEDLLFAGGQAGISGTVGEDVLFSVGEASVHGEVAGDVLGRAGTYTRNGVVRGTEKVTVGEEETPPTVAERIFAAVRRYVAVLLFGALVLWLAPAFLHAAAVRLRRRPLPSLGVGLLSMVGFAVTVVAVVTLAVLVSAVLGLLGLASLAATTILATVLVLGALGLTFAVAVVFLADAVAGITLGRLLSSRAETAPRAHQLGFMAVGLLPVVVLTALPVLGGWARLLVVLFGLGALLLAVRPATPGRPTADGSQSMART